MKIAYIIQAHKDFEKIIDLVKKLQENIKEKVDIYIHIDYKSKKLKKELLDFYNEDKSVIILKESIKVNWSGFSQVQATLLAFEKIILSNKKYKYVSLLSGECYPLKSAEYIYHFLIKSNFEYIEFEKNIKYNWRLEQFCFFSESSFNRTFVIRILKKILKNVQSFFCIKKNYFKRIDIYKGSSWFTLSLKAVDFILETTYSENLIEKYKYTSCSDEHYFQNILLNSKFKNNIINDNLRYIKWDEGKSSPNYFSKNKIGDIKTNKFFIRKIK